MIRLTMMLDDGDDAPRAAAVRRASRAEKRRAAREGGHAVKGWIEDCDPGHEAIFIEWVEPADKAKE